MIGTLWRQRSRPGVGSGEWFREWAKRGWTCPGLVGFVWRVGWLRWRGAAVGAGVMVSRIKTEGSLTRLKIGDGSFVGRAEIQLHAEVEIGAKVCINDGVRLITGSHEVRDPHWRGIARGIQIGDHAWIATGAIILPGVKIGRGAVVGAGGVVAREVPEFALAVGNPVVIRLDARCRELNYSPTMFLGCTSAWGTGRGK